MRDRNKQSNRNKAPLPARRGWWPIAAGATPLGTLPWAVKVSEEPCWRVQLLTRKNLLLTDRTIVARQPRTKFPTETI